MTKDEERRRSGWLGMTQPEYRVDATAERAISNEGGGGGIQYSYSLEPYLRAVGCVSYSQYQRDRW